VETESPGDLGFRADSDERVLIGACIRWPDIIGELRERLSAEDFYPGPHQEAFAAMQAIADRGEPTLFTTVTDELTRRGASLELRSGAYLVDCAAEVVSDHWLPWHGKRVLDASARRHLLQAGHRVEITANNPAFLTADAVREAQAIIASVPREATMGPRVVDPETLATVAAEQTIGLTEDEPLPFGLIDLDHKCLGGARRGQLIVVGGRTGFGKSALLRLMAHSFARSGPVLFASNEMTAEQLAQRDLAVLSRVDLADVIQRRQDRGIQEKLVRAEATIALTPIHNLFDWGLTSQSLRMVARELHARLGLKAIIVDYLQKIADPGRTDLERVGHAVRELKSLALELRLPVVVGAQINRRGESAAEDTNHRPTLVDLRDTGEIEQTADVVLLLYRANARYQANAPRGENTAEIIIAKQRQGEAGMMVRVAWLPSIATFANLAHGDMGKR
jgi:replicative DNA helicase